MAALTELDQAELANWLPQYGVGELSDYQRIGTGIENSNYLSLIHISEPTRPY